MELVNTLPSQGRDSEFEPRYLYHRRVSYSGYYASLPRTRQQSDSAYPHQSKRRALKQTMIFFQLLLILAIVVGLGTFLLLVGGVIILMIIATILDWFGLLEDKHDIYISIPKERK